MKRFHIIIGRLAVTLGGLAGALLAFWSGPGPSAFAAPLGGDPRGHPGLAYQRSGLPYHHPGHLVQASPPPGPPGWNKHPPLPVHAHTLVTGGMPGWQITLIAVGAALLAAALAMTVYRMRAARRRVTVSAA